MAVSPDPVISRRARRGLESVEALREMGVPVHIGSGRDTRGRRPHHQAAHGGPPARSAHRDLFDAVVAEADKWGLPVVDLRGIANDLTPDHLPGELLRLDLIKEGRQSRQAVGYLPDGDMVVVNDATHLVNQGPVAVTVLSTRPTTQGLMVFAKLAADRAASMMPMARS